MGHNHFSPARWPHGGVLLAAINIVGADHTRCQALDRYHKAAVATSKERYSILYATAIPRLYKPGSSGSIMGFRTMWL
jgi:hypothetical protein